MTKIPEALDRIKTNGWWTESGGGVGTCMANALYTEYGGVMDEEYVQDVEALAFVCQDQFPEVVRKAKLGDIVDGVERLRVVWATNDHPSMTLGDVERIMEKAMQARM